MIHQITRNDLLVITDRLKQVQEMIGYSDDKMAIMLGISKIQYSKLLRGHSMITEDKFITLRQDLGCTWKKYQFILKIFHWN